jgi:glyoxylase-like metal-dependent hydrolase (beta-lactamase superfamily II)
MPDLPGFPGFTEASSSVLERDGLRVHTFTAPAAFLANSTHVLETAGALVIVDGQFVVPYAMAFRRYVDAIGKPIAKVFLSHAHVDHYFGISAAFGDVDVSAAARTIEALAAHGESERSARAHVYGPLVPDHVVIPRRAVVPGRDTVDGVDYEIDVVTAAECDAQLLITLPGHGITIAQDLVYSGTHVYVTRDPAHSIAVLRDLIASPSTVFLPGHGPVADAAELERNIEYLTYAQGLLAEPHDPDGLRAALLARFPDRACPELLDVFLPRLFDHATRH